MNQTLRTELENVVAEVIRDVVGAVPTLMAALLLVLLAVVTAKLVERIVRFSLHRRGIQRVLHRVDADRWLGRLGARSTVADVLPRLVFWLLLLLFARAGADALELPAISQALGALTGFVPELLAAVLVLLIGGFVARVAGAAVESAAQRAGFDYAASLGRIVAVALLAVAAVMAAAQLGIDTAMIHLTAGAVLLALALGFGLAFGLGSRDVTRNIIAGHYARKTLRVGAEVGVGEVRGTLVGITPTHLLVERNGRTTSIANAAILESAVEH